MSVFFPSQSFQSVLSTGRDGRKTPVQQLWKHNQFLAFLTIIKHSNWLKLLSGLTAGPFGLQWICTFEHPRRQRIFQVPLAVR